MKSKERVKGALARTPTDRVPIFMWFHPSTAQRLAAVLEIPVGRVADAMGNDVRQTWVNNNYAMEGIVHEREGESHTDVWGITWEKQGEFNQIARFPLIGASPEDLLAYQFPEQHLDALMAPMAAALVGADDLYTGVDVSPCVFEMYWRLRGMDAAILDMASQPDVADTMLSRCADFAVTLSVESLRRFPVDWLWTGDDVAGQTSTIMGPQMWREMIRPHLQRVVDVGTAKGLPVAYHSCGAIRPIIGDLIEMGISVLNPIQCNCPGMSPVDLKREFGRELTFMGGVDTQGLLPNGSATDVRRETERLIGAMTSDGGGYILAASHTVPPETPDENIFAMYAAAGLSREEIMDRAADIRTTALG